MPVGAEGDLGGLVPPRPGGKPRDVDLGTQTTRGLVGHDLEAQGNQLCPVSAGRYVIWPLVLGTGSADDIGSRGSVRVTVELVRGEVELGRKEIVHLPVGGKL